MRLGVSIDETPVTRSNNAATPAQKCGKWRRIADRLGETYAGIRLRKSVVARTCAFADQAAAEETVWAWPWAATEIDGELPPRLHQEHQAWTIRCGQAGRRERCALIHEMAANIQPGNGAADHSRIISHFVIDEIGGKERVLWRVFAERTEAHWFEPGGRMTSLGPAANVVRARAGAIMVRKTFDDCGRRGCQMEAEVGVGARIASRLWDGGNIKIDLRPAPGIVFNQIIPAAGFRRGLIELSRLKRQEQRVLAGR
ncbi:MAG: hypothetical protein ABL904_06345 [Hyphomicrobiaceae bacterium]